MERLFNFNNRSISYTDSGQGEVIVLLHGYLETKEVWNKFSKALNMDFRVITIDLPGHGGSDIFDEIHTMEFMADVLYSLLYDLGVERLFLTGHSLGGYVTLAFVDKYPGLLSGYCLFHSHPFADSEAALARRNLEISMIMEGRKEQFYPDNIRKMFATDNLEKLDAELKVSMTIASSVKGEGIIAVLKGMMVRPSRQTKMEDGKVPCLWIMGMKDNYINYSEAARKVKLPPNARLVLLENSGHLGFIEEEGLSVKILTEFIQGIQGNR